MNPGGLILAPVFADYFCPRAHTQIMVPKAISLWRKHGHQNQTRIGAAIEEIFSPSAFQSPQWLRTVRAAFWDR
jgi:hypothetical protein